MSATKATKIVKTEVNRRVLRRQSATGMRKCLGEIDTKEAKEEVLKNAKEEVKEKENYTVEVYANDHKYYQCQACTVITGRRYNTNRHYERFHLQIKMYECKCGKTFDTKHTFNQHREEAHQIIKTYGKRSEIISKIKETRKPKNCDKENFDIMESSSKQKSQQNDSKDLKDVRQPLKIRLKLLRNNIPQKKEENTTAPKSKLNIVIYSKEKAKNMKKQEYTVTSEDELMKIMASKINF